MKEEEWAKATVDTPTTEEPQAADAQAGHSRSGFSAAGSDRSADSRLEALDGDLAANHTSA